MSERYDGYEDANGDIGRVMDEIRDIDGVVGVDLRDTEHHVTSGAGGYQAIAWSDITIEMSIRPQGDGDE